MRDEADYLAYLIQDLLIYSEVILQEQQPKLCPGRLPRDCPDRAGGEAPERRRKRGFPLINTLQGAWPRLALDRRRIAFAVSALLDNAIKFTPRGGQVSPRRRSARR